MPFTHPPLFWVESQKSLILREGDVQSAKNTRWRCLSWKVSRSCPNRCGVGVALVVALPPQPCEVSRQNQDYLLETMFKGSGIPTTKPLLATVTVWISHTIHVWYIYLHLVDFYGKCRQIYQPHGWYGLTIPWCILPKKPAAGRLKNPGLVQMTIPFKRGWF